jgi:hypothetical protein
MKKIEKEFRFIIKSKESYLKILEKIKNLNLKEEKKEIQNVYIDKDDFFFYKTNKTIRNRSGENKIVIKEKIETINGLIISEEKNINMSLNDFLQKNEFLKIKMTNNVLRQTFHYEEFQTKICIDKLKFKNNIIYILEIEIKEDFSKLKEIKEIKEILKENVSGFLSVGKREITYHNEIIYPKIIQEIEKKIPSDIFKKIKINIYSSYFEGLGSSLSDIDVYCFLEQKVDIKDLYLKLENIDLDIEFINKNMQLPLKTMHKINKSINIYSGEESNINQSIHSYDYKEIYNQKLEDYTNAFLDFQQDYLKFLKIEDFDSAELQKNNMIYYLALIYLAKNDHNIFKEKWLITKLKFLHFILEDIDSRIYIDYLTRKSAIKTEIDPLQYFIKYQLI